MKTRANYNFRHKYVPPVLCIMYISQHLVPEHPQSMYFPSCDRSRYTLIKNKSEIVVFLLHLYSIRKDTGRKKIMNRVAASIPWK